MAVLEGVLGNVGINQAKYNLDRITSDKREAFPSHPSQTSLQSCTLIGRLILQWTSVKKT